MRGPHDTLARKRPCDSPVRESLQFLSLLQVRSDSPSPRSITCHSANPPIVTPIGARSMCPSPML
jgi:hypothetical protein